MSISSECTATGLPAFRSPEVDGRHPDVVGLWKSLGIRIEDPVAPPGPDGTPSMSHLIQKPYQVAPSEDRCLICCLDEHTSFLCPYKIEVPKNATVGSNCGIVCKVCDRLFFGHCCRKDTGRAKLNLCDPPGHLSAFAATGGCPFRCVKKKKINVG